MIKLAQIADFGCAVWLDSQILGLCFLCLALLLLCLLHVAELLLMVGSDVVSQWLGRPSAHLDAYGHPIRRMVLAKEATRIFPIFVVNKELPNFGRNSLRHYSFLRNGRLINYEIFMKREKTYLTFTFKGRSLSAILNFLLKVRQIATDDLHFIISWWQWRWLCQIYSPAVLIYATQNPTRTRPGTRTFNHYPTRSQKVLFVRPCP